MDEIPSAHLEPGDVPDVGADAAELRRFALTFNAYRRIGGPGRLAQVHEQVVDDLEAGRLPGLDQLRATCFYLVRAADNETDPQALERIDAELRRMLEPLRRAVADLPPPDTRRSG